MTLGGVKLVVKCVFRDVTTVRNAHFTIIKFYRVDAKGITAFEVEVFSSNDNKNLVGISTCSHED
jgi:hypothetical protein